MEKEESLAMKISEVHSIALESMGAAGFQISYRSDDSSIIEVRRVENASQKKNPSENKNIGGPVTAYFEIKAVKKGQTKVVFFQSRPWEKNGVEMVQKTLLVKVVD